MLGEEIGHADESTYVAAKEQAEADDPEGQGPEGKVHEILHDDIAGILAPRQAGFEHGETGLHEEDQDGRHEDPEGIDR